MNTKIKKEKDTKSLINQKEGEVASSKDTKKKIHPLLNGPRLTEKSALASEHGVYTFNVKPESNKNEIKKAIKIVYGVVPQKVTITKIKSKKVTRRGKTGVKPGGKKAAVYLKKGDKITFV